MKLQYILAILGFCPALVVIFFFFPSLNPFPIWLEILFALFMAFPLFLGLIFPPWLSSNIYFAVFFLGLLNASLYYLLGFLISYIREKGLTRYSLFAKGGVLLWVIVYIASVIGYVCKLE